MKIRCYQCIFQTDDPKNEGIPICGLAFKEKREPDGMIGLKRSEALNSFIFYCNQPGYSFCSEGKIEESDEFDLPL